MPERPLAGEYTPFQADYVALVPEEDILPVLTEQVWDLAELENRISPEKEFFRYAPGKWSVREVFGHLSDAERVFGYRALCMARGQQEAMPAFDENLFVDTGNFDRRTLKQLAGEWQLLRRANLSLLHGLEPAAWTRTCLANDAVTSTRAVAWIMAGHLRHHLAILKDRYGVA